MNSFDNIWNMNFIQQQSMAQRHHLEQQQQVIETVQKLQEYLDSWDKIEPQYQSEALAACCGVLLYYMNKHGS